MDREDDENGQFFVHIAQDKTPQEVATAICQYMVLNGDGGRTAGGRATALV